MTDVDDVATPDWCRAIELPRLNGAGTPARALRSNFPDHPLATDEPARGCWRHQRHDALEMAYIAPNDPKLKRWIVVDVDHEDPIDWVELHLPMPYAEVRNRWDGRRHLLWMLAAPVSTGPKARTKPQAWREAIRSRLTRACGGDPAYAEGLCKTPFHPRWQTSILCPVAWSLSGLDAATELHKGFGRPPVRGDGASASRNVALFDALRARAYRMKSEGSTACYAAFQGAVAAVAHAIAPLIARDLAKPPLSYGQVASCARSVSKWTWRRYDRRPPQTAFERRSRQVAGHDPRLFEVHVACAADAAIWDCAPGSLTDAGVRRAIGRSVQASLDQLERAIAAYRKVAALMGRPSRRVCDIAVAAALGEPARWARAAELPTSTFARLMRRLWAAPGARLAPSRAEARPAAPVPCADRRKGASSPSDHGPSTPPGDAPTLASS